MKKKSIIIASIVLIILGLLYFLTGNIKEQKADRSSKTGSILVTSLDVKNVRRLEIINDEGNMLFEKGKKLSDNNYEWKIIEPRSIEFNQDELNKILNTASKLEAAKIIEENPKDLSVYGLDKPSLIKLYMQDNSKVILELGSKSPTDSGYYLKKNDSKTVYLIRMYKGRQLAAKKDDIRVKRLFSIEAEDINSLSLYKNEKLTFTAKKVNEFTWQVTSPTNYSANASAIELMLEPISHLEKFSFIKDEVSDFSDYGFDKPSYKIIFEDKSGKQIIILGDEKERGKELYARLDNSPEVFTLYEESLNFLDKPLDEILDIFVYIPNLVDIHKIDLKMNGTQIESILDFEQKRDGKNSCWVNGKKISDSDIEKMAFFRQYFKSLIELSKSEVNLDVHPALSPVVTLIYTLKKDNQVVQLDFVNCDEKYFYAFKNKKYTGILVSKDQFYGEEGVKKKYETLLSAIK